MRTDDAGIKNFLLIAYVILFSPTSFSNETEKELPVFISQWYIESANTKKTAILLRNF